MLLSNTKQIQFQELTADQKQQHYYIEQDDVCFYLGEYTARAGFSHSETNQLILNFKKKLDRIDTPEWKYKIEAINKVVLLINEATIPQSDTLFVPVPPSKSKDDNLYDDRLIQVLGRLKSGWMGNGYRELVVQNTSAEPSHSTDNKREVGKLASNYVIDDTLLEPDPKRIIIFDDVLTTGCHYKAVQQTLRTVYPDATYYGMFLARRKIDEINPV